MIWAFLALTLAWTIAVLRLGALDQLHHFWYGVWLFALGYRWVGLAIMADDAVQHAVQCWRPKFRSPLHLLFRFAINLP